MKFQMFLIICYVAKGNHGKIHLPQLKLPKLPSAEDRLATTLDTMSQRIDHFSFFNRRKFNMRYYSNDQFFNGTGPMFVFVGGESSIEEMEGYFHSGLFYDMAKENGAYMFAPEHRYYGDSIPNGNLGIFNLRHLTIKQVLADLADFIKDRKNSIPGLQNSKVVMLGGSYPANLAAWMRLKYPDIVDAAVASSGVFNIKVDNYEFNEVVQNGLSAYPNCVETIKEAVLSTKEKLKTFAGKAQVAKDFQLTSGILLNVGFMKTSLFNSIMYSIDTVVQYNTETEALNMKTMCSLLTNTSVSTDPYARLVNYMAQVKKSNSDLNASAIDINSVTSWSYQICTQLGSFVTTSSPNQPFSNTVPLSFWNEVCLLTFGILINPLRTWYGVSQTAQEYSGMSMSVTKVVFTVGSVDPWSGIGLKEDLNDLAPVIVIQGSSHCADLLPATVTNSTELTNARNRVKSLVSTWIQPGSDY